MKPSDIILSLASERPMAVHGAVCLIASLLVVELELDDFSIEVLDLSDSDF